jgi:hypothetical protein
MLRLIDSLPNTDVINFKESREVVTITFRKGAQTIRITTFITVTVATSGAGSWEAPRMRDCRIHDQIHRLTWDLGPCNVQTVPINSIAKLPIYIPLDISARAVLLWRFPFNAVFVLPPVVRHIQRNVG